MAGLIATDPLILCNALELFPWLSDAPGIPYILLPALAGVKGAVSQRPLHQLCLLLYWIVIRAGQFFNFF